MRAKLIAVSLLALGSSGQLAQSRTHRTVDVEDGGHAVGTGPRDLFSLPPGYAQDLTVVEDTPADRADNVLRLPGRNPAMARVTEQDGGELNLYWSDQRSGVTIPHQFLSLHGHRFGVQRIVFDNGVTWTETDLAKKLGTASKKVVLTPAETWLPREEPVGPLFAFGHGVADRFRMRANTGNLTVFEVAASHSPRNEIILDRPHISTTAELYDDHGDAVISWYGENAARLTIVGALVSRPGSRYGLQHIRFGDGKVWTERDLLERFRQPSATASNGWLHGGTGGDLFDSRGRAHGIEGRGGGDTIIYRPGYGRLDIDETDAGPRPHNRLVFGTGIPSSDVIVRRNRDDLILTPTGKANFDADEIQIRGQYKRSPGIARGIQVVTFPDHTAWDYAQLVERAATTSEHNRDPEGDANANVFRITGDTRSATGHGGGDRFELAYGYINVEIREVDHGQHAPNRLFMPAGIKPTDVVALRDGNGIYLEIKMPDRAGRSSPFPGVMLVDQAAKAPGADNGVQEVVFADGYCWTASTVLRLAAAQPLNHEGYDAKVRADAEALRTRRVAMANDPARFRQFVTDLRLGMTALGIEKVDQDVLLPGTLLEMMGEVAVRNPAHRWRNLPTLARWQIGLRALAARLQSRYVFPDALPGAMCDLAPCPPPTRAEVIASTVADLPLQVLPHVAFAPPPPGGGNAPPPLRVAGPLRIAATGDAKMDAAIRAAILQLGPRSGLPLDAQSFPVPRAQANVLIVSLGTWAESPRFIGRSSDRQSVAWYGERRARFAWRFARAPVSANPLFAFVSSKVHSVADHIEAEIGGGQFVITPVIGTNAQGAVIAAACAPDPYADSVTECLRSIGLTPAADHRSVESRRGSRPSVFAMVNDALRWLVDRLRVLI